MSTSLAQRVTGYAIIAVFCALGVAVGMFLLGGQRTATSHAETTVPSVSPSPTQMLPSQVLPSAGGGGGSVPAMPNPTSLAGEISGSGGAGGLLPPTD